jgi:hypothetical protein
MYKRYISQGNNAKESMIFCKVNRLAYSKRIDKHDITSRTRIILMDTIDNHNGASMEKMILFAYFYNIKNNNFSETEYKYYKKLIIAYGKNKLNNILEHFSSKDGCVGIKEEDDENKYRIIYFAK